MSNTNTENYPHFCDPPSPVLPELNLNAAEPNLGSSKLIEMATVNSLKGKTDFLLGNSKPQKRIEVGSEDYTTMRKMAERKLGTKEKEKDEFEIMIETLKLMNDKCALTLKNATLELNQTNKNSTTTLDKPTDDPDDPAASENESQTYDGEEAGYKDLEDNTMKLEFINIDEFFHENATQNI